MSDRRITRRQALLAGGSALVATALGAGAAQAVGGSATASPLATRADFLPLVGRRLRATDVDGRTGRLALEALEDLRHARPGSDRDFVLTFIGDVDQPWWSDVLAVTDERGRATELLVTRTALPGSDGSQRYTALINGSPVGAQI